MVTFLYRTRAGHALLSLLLGLRLDRALAHFLRTPLSRLVVPLYVRAAGVDLSQCRETSFSSFRAFFLRGKKDLRFDMTPSHLISPCDAMLGAFRIREDMSLQIKGMRYTLPALFGREAPELSDYAGGCALVLRLAASDYHHYHYFDDCTQLRHHRIEGSLHSVQEAALKTYPVFVLNRRTWSVLETAHFGRVLQAEIGAFAVGGIVNHYDGGTHLRGEEKGHFDLAGSTIVLFFERGRVRLNGALAPALRKGAEVRVTCGQKIGSSAF